MSNMTSERFARIQKAVGEETKKFLIRSRESAGLTQAEAAKLLGHSSTELLNTYESGASVPMPDMQKIMISYGLPIDALFEYMERVQKIVQSIDD